MPESNPDFRPYLPVSNTNSPAINRPNFVAGTLSIYGVNGSSNKTAKPDNYDRIRKDNLQSVANYRAGIRALMEQKQGELNSILDAITLTNRQLADLDADVGLQDITTRTQFLANRANRINELKSAYEQHAQQFGAALNDKAIDILQRHSIINAPTLTSIMTGWEMARASQRDNDRVRLENIAKMYDQISQLEDRAMQIEMDAHKANLQHQRNEAEHARGLLENQMKVLEDIYGMTKEMEEKSLNAAISRTTAAAGAPRGSSLDGGGIDVGELESAMGKPGGAPSSQEAASKKSSQKAPEQQEKKEGSEKAPPRKLTAEMIAKDDLTSEELRSAIREYGGFNSEEGSLSRNMRERFLEGKDIPSFGRGSAGSITYDSDKGELVFAQLGEEFVFDNRIRLSSTQKKEFEENGKIPKFDSRKYARESEMLSDLQRVNEQNAKKFEKDFGKEHGFDVYDKQSFIGLPEDKKGKVRKVLGIDEPTTSYTPTPINGEIEAWIVSNPDDAQYVNEVTYA